jgi:hypothetical protein
MQGRRTFTTEQKISLLDAASQPGASVSGVAKANQLNPSLMFGWRKQLSFANGAQQIPTTEVGVQEGLLNEIEHFEHQVAPLVIEKFMRDLRTDQISSYNACTSLSSLVNSFSKLAELKMNVYDKWSANKAVEQAAQKTPEELQKERDLREFAEKMLVETSRQQALSKERTND